MGVCTDSNKKLKDALAEFTEDIGLSKQQDEVCKFTVAKIGLQIDLLFNCN